MTGTHDYQLFFTDQACRLIGHQRFQAESDLEALRIAGAVFRACHDACDVAEVWRNGARLFRLAGSDADRPFWVTGPGAELVAEIEENLAHSEWPIARSRGLLSALSTHAHPAMLPGAGMSAGR